MKIPVFYEIEKSIRNFKKKLILSKKLNFMQQYDLIFSLGEACFCATFLKLTNLRKCSCPFDWMYGASFFERLKILDNKFENFLNIEDLEYIDKRLKPEPCNIYKNNKNNLVFNHDFKINTPLEQSFPQVKQKYDRRIKRLLKELNKKQNNVLIVYIKLPENDVEVLDEDLIIGIEKLNSTYNSQIDLIYIEHDEQMVDEEYHYRKISKNITKINLYNKTRGNDEIKGNFNNCTLIFNKIGIKLKTL